LEADHASLAGALRGRGLGRPERPFSSAGALPASDAGCNRGPGLGDASRASLLGSASNRLRAAAERRPAGALRVGGLSVPGPSWGHQPDDATPTPGDLETMGARRPDGVVAAGSRARLPSGGWDLSQGADRNRRPLEVLRIRSPHGQRANPVGL